VRNVGKKRGGKCGACEYEGRRRRNAEETGRRSYMLQERAPDLGCDVLLRPLAAVRASASVWVLPVKSKFCALLCCNPQTRLGIHISACYKNFINEIIHLHSVIESKDSDVMGSCDLIVVNVNYQYCDSADCKPQCGSSLLQRDYYK
jgi:hypothetical protein